MKKIEDENDIKKMQMQHTLEIKKQDNDNTSSSNVTHIFEKKEKIQPYEEKGDHDSYLSYFKEAINNLSEDKQRFELKKTFLNASIAKNIRELDNIEEIHNHYKLFAEDYRR